MRAAALAVLLVGCSAALTPVTPEQAAGLKNAQRIADTVTAAYGVGRVKVYASSGLQPTTAAGYLYRQDWIFIRPTHLEGDRFAVVLSHELAHVTLGHRPLSLPPNQLRERIASNEDAANQRGVEIMVRFFGVSEQEAVDQYTDYFTRANLVRDGRPVNLPYGYPHPCDSIRNLWARFRPAEEPPACDMKPVVATCPYDNWNGTGCKAGQSR